MGLRRWSPHSAAHRRFSAAAKNTSLKARTAYILSIFNYPYSDTDDVTITPPLGWQVSDLPQPQSGDLKALAYSISVEKKDGALHVSRRLMVNVEMVDVQQYATVRRFFGNVRSADDQQVVLSAAVN